MRKKRTTDQVAAENAAGMAALEGLQQPPPPGAATQSSRLHGLFAALTWGGTSAIICSDWEVNLDQDFVDGTAHGEYWDYPVPIKQMWTARVQAYVVSGGPGVQAGQPTWVTWMAAHILYYGGFKISTDPSRAFFHGWAGPVDSPSGNQYIFRGEAYVSRGGFSAPKRGAATQELQLRGYGPPAFGPTA